MKFEFQDVSIEVTPTNDSRRWYMTLEETAMAYGVADSSVRSTLHRHPDEIREGVEKGVAFCNTLGGKQQVGVLYREGVIKLGFFMRGERAKAFRQFATNLIIEHLEQQGQSSPYGFQELMNRLDELQSCTQQRLDRVENVCRGLRDEVDELRATLNLLINEDDEKMIRSLISRIKDRFNCDGRAVVGKVRSHLNLSSIYETPNTKLVINALKVILGEGLTVVKE